MSIVLSPGQSVTLAGADTKALTCITGGAVYSDAERDGLLELDVITPVSDQGDVEVRALTNSRIYVTPTEEFVEKEAAQLIYPSDTIKTVVGSDKLPKEALEELAAKEKAEKKAAKAKAAAEAAELKAVAAKVETPKARPKKKPTAKKPAALKKPKKRPAAKKKKSK